MAKKLKWPNAGQGYPPVDAPSRAVPGPYPSYQDVLAYCEELETEGVELEEEAKGDPNSYGSGFAQGQRSTAKRIRRELGETIRLERDG